VWKVGIVWVVWGAGKRRSKILRYESDDTADTRVGECGENEVEYVQEFVGSVYSDCSRFGDQILTVPSQELDAKVVFSTRFQ